ncbi:MAG TPA: hypothetical protein VEU76_00795 [Candidatus Udaeobacter sp.]|nr:hypothetical protein [Candidatus Udaeobacter sp.]
MGEERRNRGWRGNRGGCGCGCAGVFIVLTVGLLLSIFNADVGIGVSVRIPFTNANATAAGSVGKKDKAPDALPAYVRQKLGSNQDFINGSNTLTIWVAEGTSIVVVGDQPGAPVVDLHLELR